MRNASYRGIPCWYNPVNDELKGKNWFYDFIVSLNIWFDFHVLRMEGLPIWVEVDEMEKK